VRLKTPRRRKYTSYERPQEALDLGKRPKRKKTDMRFGTWSVRSMYRAGSIRAVAEEI
jgi:hypothetical protein